MESPFESVAQLWSALADHLEPDGHPLTREAYRVATEAHDGQTHAQGVPYTAHLLRVALRLVARGWNDDRLLAAALLHDVVEDTAATGEALAAQFGEDVAEWVRVLTKPDKGARPDDWEARYYAGIREAALEARRIKCADRIDNLTVIRFRGAEKAESYRTETREWVLPIAAATDAHFLAELEALSRASDAPS